MVLRGPLSGPADAPGARGGNVSGKMQFLLLETEGVCRDQVTPNRRVGKIDSTKF